MADIRKLDLKLLIAFDALLDERNVTRAAIKLGYTQPTISGMLARLRDVFDDPLFARAQRGLIPTPRALALGAPVKQLIADSQRLVVRDLFNPSTSEMTFTISSNDYMQHALLVPFIKVLRSEAKQVRIAITPPMSSNRRKFPRSTASPSLRAVIVESECIASQKSSSTSGSSPSNIEDCTAGSQVVGRFVRSASVSLPQPG